MRMIEDIDPATLEVVRNRLDVIAEEMQASLIRSAHSSIVREASDASSAILDPEGGLISQARGVPVHLGSIDAAVRSICRTYPVKDMVDGDVFIINDPYADAQHLSDVVIMAPILWDGITVALAACMAHQQDIGGMSPGSMPQNATELYQEGLILPPLHLYRAGKPERAVFEILKRNVRIPDVVLGDVSAQVACVVTGKRRIATLLEEFGTEKFRRMVSTLQGSAETITRQLLSEMPEGTYEFVDYLDNDGIDLETRVRIQVAVTIKDGEFVADFTGSSPQVRGPFNALPSVAMSAVRYVVRAVTDPNLPNNAGCYKPIRLITPRGSIVNPNPPAPVSNRGATLRRLTDCVMGALVQAIPDRVPAANNGHPLLCSIGGIDPRSGQQYVTTILTTGGQGGRPTKDGVDAVCTDASNSMNVPIEHLESYFPLRIHRWSLRNGSGGAGRWRGGLGIESFVEILRGNAIISHRGERHYSSPWGLFGGTPGERCVSEVFRSSGVVERIPSKADVSMAAGDVLRFYTTGGGGYGDPLERELRLVAADVKNEKISPHEALETYGLEFKGDDIDHGRSAERRAKLRAQRGEINWIYDRGEGQRQ